MAAPRKMFRGERGHLGPLGRPTTFLTQLDGVEGRTTTLLWLVIGTEHKRLQKQLQVIAHLKAEDTKYSEDFVPLPILQTFLLYEKHYPSGIQSNYNDVRKRFKFF